MSDDWLDKEFAARSQPAAPLSADLILRRARGRDARQRTVRNTAKGAGLALLLLFVGWSSFVDGRSRGPAGPDGSGELVARGAEAPATAASVSLSWLLDHSPSVETLPMQLTSSDSVVFVVRASQPGNLCLEEAADDGSWTRVHPEPGGSWVGVAGDNVPRAGDSLLAFRTERGPTPRAYRVLLDPDSADCRSPIVGSSTVVPWGP